MASRKFTGISSFKKKLEEEKTCTMDSRCSGRLDHIEARNNGTLDQVVSIKRTTDGFNVTPLALQEQYLQNSHLWHPVSSATKELN
jgi:hypothetical protein